MTCDGCVPYTCTPRCTVHVDQPATGVKSGCTTSRREGQLHGKYGGGRIFTTVQGLFFFPPCGYATDGAGTNIHNLVAALRESNS